MKDKINRIKQEVENFKDIKKLNVQKQINTFFEDLDNRVDKFIGDYPTFIEPVYLEDNVKIGDDVLLGPNVYVGKNSEIKDYVELSNTILLNNVTIGENFKLENCIVLENCSLDFKDLNLKKSIIIRSASSKSELEKHEF